MRIVFGVVALAAALWSGYWFVGSRGVEAGLRGWLDARAAEGWVAEYSDLRTAGFPNRFDTTITALELADPDTGVAWSAPFFQIFALSYEPNHIIAAWPPRQTFASPHQRVTVTSEKIQASVIFTPDTALELDHSNFVLDGVSLASNAGWSAELAQGLFATRRAAARANAHDIALEARNLRLSEDLLAALDPTGLLPRGIEHLGLDATLDFDAPWDRAAIENARPAITRVRLNLLRARWGDLDLRAAGDLEVDATGVPSGTITVKAKNWREMLAIGVAAGWVPPSLAPTLETGLGFLAGLSGHPDTLDAPLSFRNGTVSFGPVPLGRAPRLKLR